MKEHPDVIGIYENDQQPSGYSIAKKPYHKDILYIRRDLIIKGINECVGDLPEHVAEKFADLLRK